jgi:hypothetical protein
MMIDGSRCIFEEWQARDVLCLFVYPHSCILPNVIAYSILAAKLFVITVRWKLFPDIDDDAGWLFRSHIFSSPGLGPCSRQLSQL